MGVKLSILIPHVKVREELLSRLLSKLEPQLTPEVEVIIHSRPDTPMGDKVNEMTVYAKGDFTVVVDDDDLLAKDYTKSVLDAISDKTDYVGYKIQSFHDGELQSEIVCRTDGDWRGDDRGIVHKCPLRRSIAKEFTFGNHYTADRQWSKDITDSGLVRAGAYINKPLYIYDFWSTGTLGTEPGGKNQETQRKVGMHKFDEGRFLWL